MVTTTLIGSIFLLAGLVQGITGFGSALIAIPLLCLVIDIKLAIPLSVLNSLAINSLLMVKMRRHLDAKALLPLCLAALPGTIVGVTLLKRIDSGGLALLLGILLVTYSFYSLFFPPRQRNIHFCWSYLAGFCSGAIGAAFSAGGPPVIIYTALTGWDKDRIKATLTGFFFINSCLAATAHAVTGLTTSEVLSFFLLSCPFVLLGTVAGIASYRFLGRKTYLQTMYLLLIVMGAMMITLRG